MADYISRGAAIAYIREQSEEMGKAFEELGGESGFYADAYNDLAEDFYRVPAADVEPVVRCRECRYYAVSGATTSFCIHPGGMKFTSDSDYCSRGKRRDQSADVRNIGQFASSGKTGGPNDADQH